MHLCVDHFVTRPTLCMAPVGFQLDFFSSPEPKAHERANSIPVTPSSVRPSVLPSTFSNISSKTTGPIELEFYMDAGTKVCSNGPGHMTKMAANGENLHWT